MRIFDRDWSLFAFIRALFPLQLVFSHLKYNFLALLVWGMLFAVINDSLGTFFGVPYLFLSPEYLNAISFESFLLLGFALGGFIMGFNTYSYIRLGPLYPFLITINRPFFKFCINNGLIPFVFVTNYLINMISFQYTEEYATVGETLLFSFGFLLGITIFLTLSWLLFFRLIKYDPYKGGADKPFKTMSYQNNKWYDIFRKQKEYPTIYFGKRLRFKVSRSSKHFDRELVASIFAKNRVSASLYELLTILIFFGLGLFNEYDVFEVPASTSIVLLLTIILMLYSALQAWLRNWFYPILVGVLLMMNYMSKTTELFHYESYAYGLSYDKSDLSEYSVARIKEICSDEQKNEASFENYIQMLEAWKAQTGQEKPKLIIVNTSGGGSRSALWTTLVLNELDEVSNNEFGRHTQMITGASGGMVGAAYYREVQLRRAKNERAPENTQDLKREIGSDILNKLSFMASTNDIFVRYQKIDYAGIRYTKDRGYAFEQQLHENTHYILNHNLGYYTNYEKQAKVPTLIFTPTIINDGRRLMVSSQDLHFLASGHYAGAHLAGLYENIEIRGLLDKQNIDKLRFSTVLRSSATFPFVMPMITLPTSPSTQLMDAGIRDNYGTKTTMLFLHSLEKWITENTSGVLVVEIRDTRKVYEEEKFQEVSFIDKLTLPFGNMYKNFPRIQSYNQKELEQLGLKSLDFPIETVTFNLMQQKGDRISLSWHLTQAEKLKIESALSYPSNRKALDVIKKSFSE
ncbi:MAG: hypothetical protein NXI10_11730 [bacterium]|nr:hypothetical protein [bacterium]